MHARTRRIALLLKRPNPQRRRSKSNARAPTDRPTDQPDAFASHLREATKATRTPSLLDFREEVGSERRRAYRLPYEGKAVKLGFAIVSCVVPAVTRAPRANTRFFVTFFFLPASLRLPLLCSVPTPFALSLSPSLFTFSLILLLPSFILSGSPRVTVRTCTREIARQIGRAHV